MSAVVYVLLGVCECFLVFACACKRFSGHADICIFLCVHLGASMYLQLLVDGYEYLHGVFEGACVCPQIFACSYMCLCIHECSCM